MRSNFLWMLALLAAGALTLAACPGQGCSPGPVGQLGAQGAPTEQGPPGKSFVVSGPGLKAEIVEVEFPADGNPVVTLSLTDGDARLLTPEDLEDYGFTVAQLLVNNATGITQWENTLIQEGESGGPSPSPWPA